MDGAGTALAEAAAEARPMQSKLISENVEERRLGIIDADRYRPAVHAQPSWSHRNLLASRCDAARRRSHEFGADRIGDGCAQDALDLRLGGRIERPPAHLVDRLQLVGAARAPQRGADPLIQHPADRQVDDPLAEPSLRKAIEPFHGGQILRKARRLEFWIRAPQIVALEFAILPHPAGEETAAQRAIAQSRDLVLAAIGQDIGLDAALE